MKKLRHNSTNINNLQYLNKFYCASLKFYSWNKKYVKLLKILEDKPQSVKYPSTPLNKHIYVYCRSEYREPRVVCGRRRIESQPVKT
jgi:hypothetical protein